MNSNATATTTFDSTVSYSPIRVTGRLDRDHPAWPQWIVDISHRAAHRVNSSKRGVPPATGAKLK